MAENSWFRRLLDGRVEVLVTTRTHRLRASGPPDYVYKLVDLFEEETGVRVEGGWARPPRSGRRPLPGSLSLFEKTDSDPSPELASGDTLAP